MGIQSVQMILNYTYMYDVGHYTRLPVVLIIVSFCVLSINNNRTVKFSLEIINNVYKI